MANSKLLKEAIADAKAVKETAIANAKIALEEAFTPKLQSILSKKLQSEMEEEEDEVEEVAEEVDSSGIGGGDNKEPEYDEAHTELDPETEKETAAPGEELDAVEKVDDLKEGEHSEDEVEETVSEENAEVKEETEVNEVESDDEEEANEGYHEDDEDEVDEELNLEDIIKELEEAYATVKELKGTINEVNLLNAKLLYANKLFRSYAMNNDQKSKVVETLDRTKSVREVKLVFATLAESMKFGGETKKVRVTEGIASKPQASTAPKKEIISESNEIANRFKKLANIK